MHINNRLTGLRNKTMLRPYPIVITLLLFLLTITFSCQKKEEVKVDYRPNVFVLTIDSLRSDFLGCYGNNIIKTPNLDRESKSSILMSRMIGASPYTVPALASIMTGKYPLQHNARNVVLIKTDTSDASSTHEVVDLPLQKDITTWSSFLKDRGYVTQAVVGGFTTTGSFSGLNNGFDTFDDDIQDVYRKADQVLEKALTAISQTPSKPHFCWFHLFDTHYPYHDSKGFETLYNNVVFYDAIDDRCDIDSPRIKELIGENTGIDFLNKIVQRYAAAISMVDNKIGVFRQEVLSRFKGRRNFVIFTADHGESLLEHCELFDHGSEVFNTTIHVPCLINTDQKNLHGQIIDSLSRTIDIWPTIDEYLGYSRSQDDRSGKGLKSLMTGKTTDVNLSAFVESKIIINGQRTFALIKDNWKYIQKPTKSGREEFLYQLDIDPSELNDLSDKYDEKSIQMRELLEESQKLQTDIDTSQIEISTQDENTKDKLRSLGYLGD